MTYENDKFSIPEKYQKMSVSELRMEKERLYVRLKKEPITVNKKVDKKKGTIVFNL